MNLVKEVPISVEYNMKTVQEKGLARMEAYFHALQRKGKATTTPLMPGTGK